jgi:hypothetical protein
MKREGDRAEIWEKVEKKEKVKEWRKKRRVKGRERKR